MSSKGTFVLSKNGDTISISGKGELSLYVAPELKAMLDSAVSSGETVEVDLKNAQYIDSAIIAALVGANKRLMTAGRRLKVVTAGDSHPQYVMEITGLNNVIDVIVAEKGKSSGRMRRPT